MKKLSKSQKKNLNIQIEAVRTELVPEVTNKDRADENRLKYEKYLTDLKTKRKSPGYETSYHKPIVNNIERKMSYNKEFSDHLRSEIVEAKKPKPKDFAKRESTLNTMDKIVEKAMAYTKLDEKKVIGTLINTYPLAMPKLTIYAISKNIVIDMTLGSKLFPSEIKELIETL